MEALVCYWIALRLDFKQKTIRGLEISMNLTACYVFFLGAFCLSLAEVENNGGEVSPGT